MYILGLSCFYHDSAAALIHDGIVIAAAQEERFTRIKHDQSFPINAINFCMKKSKITVHDLEYVVFYEKPFVKFERILLSILSTFPKSMKLFRDSMMVWLGEKLWIKNIIKEKLGIPDRKILFVEHHLSHAASTFFCSPYKEAAILSIDGVGEWSTVALGSGTADWDGNGQNEIRFFDEMRFPHSLGLLYSAFTAFLGFEVNEGEYKVMGMAPYGKAKYVDNIIKVVDVKGDGSFRLDMSYFGYHYHSESTINSKFLDLFGQPRNPKSRFVTDKTSIYDDPHPPTKNEILSNQYYADVAASLQNVTEDILIKISRYLHSKTGIKNLCIAGGVGLNSVANYKILKETPFDEIYIQPASGDAGGALGAALYVYHVILNKPRNFVMEHALWGEEYDINDITSFLKNKNIKHESIEEDSLFNRIVENLIKGKVIGWYQGRFEWGPRALGNRSILADPTNPKMKDIVNIKIKFREPFRPFAPSVLEDKVEDFFDINEAARHYPTRFMLYVTQVKSDRIPAITHVDGSGRLQTVKKRYNPRYYRLIELFGQATGVPVVLNTSFNLKGEPIVTTPQDAFNTFMKSGMDILVLENCFVDKERL